MASLLRFWEVSSSFAAIRLFMLSMTPLFFRRKRVVRAVGADHVAAIISAGAVASIASVLLVMQLAQTRIFFLVSDPDHLHQL